MVSHAVTAVDRATTTTASVRLRTIEHVRMIFPWVSAVFVETTEIRDTPPTRRAADPAVSFVK